MSHRRVPSLSRRVTTETPSGQRSCHTPGDGSSPLCLGSGAILAFGCGRTTPPGEVGEDGGLSLSRVGSWMMWPIRSLSSFVLVLGSRRARAGLSADGPVLGLGDHGDACAA